MSAKKLGRSVMRARARAAQRRQRSRMARIETLESRLLMAVDWRNPVDSLDINQDGRVSPVDALVVINDLNRDGARILPVPYVSGPRLDSDGSGAVGPIDALLVINALNRGHSDPMQLVEDGRFARELGVTITTGQQTGVRTYRFQVDAHLDTTDTQTPLEDLFAVYLVDPRDRSRTLLDGGTPGSPLFSLRGGRAEYLPGQVRFDGSIVELDLSAATQSDTANLIFQLVSTDSDSGTRFTIRPLSNEVDPEAVSSPVLELSQTAGTAGGELQIASLTAAEQVDVEIENASYSPSNQLLRGELRLSNRGGAVGQTIAVSFPGLPTGVALQNASGVTPAGDPYLNLTPAMLGGGLGPGARSEAVVFEIVNPRGVRFPLRPVVLSSGANRPPVWSDLGPLNVFPGAPLSLDLLASDADGDFIRYAIRSDAPLPPHSVRGSRLRLDPRPEDIGSYPFEVIASDGLVSVVQSVTLNVLADPLKTTRISGRVLDVDQTPLAGMQVELGSVQGLTQTDGSFTLDMGPGPLISDTLKIRGETYGNSAIYPFIAEKLPLVLERAVYAGVNNVIERPIYLPKLDLANGQAVDPLRDTTVTTEAIPGASVFISSGTLLNQQGAPFAGLLSMTEVPASLTPAALPNGLTPDLVVTIQPGEMVFASPAPLTLPNRGGYAPGTKMDLWSINPSTGEFDDVGDGLVSADGSVVQTVSGGVRNSSWHFVAPPPNVTRSLVAQELMQNLNNALSPRAAGPCDECSGTVEGTSHVESHSGAVIETHAVTTYRSLGTAQGLVLTYDSARADARPIVHFGFNEADPNIYSVPEAVRLIAQMKVSRGDWRFQVPGYAGGEHGLVGGEHIWRVPSQSGSLSVALQADLRDQPSGVYDYEILYGLRGYAGSRGFIGTSLTSASQFIHVNSATSPFGAGWGIAGLLELVENRDGAILMIDGDGSELLFRPHPEGGYASPAGDFSRLERLGDGTFRRTLSHGAVQVFNAQHKLQSITDRTGNQTQYAYDDGGRLVAVTDAVGLQTTLVYSAGRVEITDPAGRVTRLDMDGGNLVAISDPDGARRQWAYDAAHRMVSETDQVGHSERMHYGFHGRAQRAFRKDGTVLHYEPLDTKGLFPAAATAADPLANPPQNPIAERVPAPTSRYVQAGGRVIESVLDQAGQVAAARDSLGSLPSVQRNAQNLPTVVTDARGNVTSYEYDEAGNVIRETTGLADLNPRFGSALVFDGVDDWARSATTEVMRNFPLTLEAWVRPAMRSVTGFAPNSVISSDRAGFGGHGFGVLVNPQGSFLVVETHGGGTFRYIPHATMKADQWYHVATVYTPASDTNPNQVVRTYVDGLLHDEYHYERGEVPTPGVSHIHIGRHNDRNDGYPEWFYQGALDEVRVWNIARTAEEIRNDRYRSLIGDEAGLSAYYTFDAESGNVIQDRSTNQLHASRAGGEAQYIETEILGPAADRAVAAPDGRVHYYPGDGDAKDAVSGRSASAQGDLQYVPGKVGTAFQLDGVNDQVELGRDFNLQSFSLAFWAKPGEHQVIYTDIMDNGHAARHSWVIQQKASEQNHYAFGISDGANQNIVEFELTPSVWQHVAIVHDGTTSESRVYVDGVLIGSDSGIGRVFYDGRASLRLGNWREGGRHWKGEIDELQMFSRPLSAGEVAAVMASGTIASRHVGWWAGDGDATDLVAGHHGVFVGGAGTGPGYVERAFQFDGVDDFIAVADPADDSLELAGDLTIEGWIQRSAASDQPQTIISKRALSNADVSYELFIEADGKLAFTSRLGGGDLRTVVSPLPLPLGTFSHVAVTIAAAELSFYAHGALISKHAYAVDRPATEGRVTIGGAETADGLIRPFAGGIDELSLYSQALAPSEIATIASAKSAGKLKEHRDEAATPPPAVRTYTYDPVFNQLTSETDPLGNQTIYELDPARGNRVLTRKVVGLVDSPDNGETDDAVTRFSYTPLGLLQEVIDAEGFATRYDYDARGRLLAVTFGAGTAEQAVERYEYDAVGNRTALIDVNHRRTSYRYDARNRLKSITRPDGSSTTYEHDDRGNLTAVTDPRGSVTRYEYDALDRLTNVTRPGQAPSRFAYDAAGNLVTVTDARGAVTRYGYDARGRRVRQTDPEGGVTHFRYDPENNLRSVIDAKGNRTEYVYDARNRLFRTVDAAGGIVEFAYDAADQVIATTDQRGNTTRTTYDPLGRVSQVTLPDPDGPEGPLGSPLFTTTYDKRGNRKTVVDPLGNLMAFDYDSRSRLIRTVTPDPDGSGPQQAAVTRIKYDALGNLERIVDAAGAATEFVYDALNRRVAMVDALSQRIQIAYDAAGNILTTTDAAGRETRFEYDAVGRRTASIDAAGKRTTYTYDATDNLTSVTDPLGATVRYTYDGLNRLRSMTDPLGGTIEHTYDALGNRLTMRDAEHNLTSYAYDSLSRLVAETDALGKVRSFEYDAAGNLLQRTDRLGRQVEFAYDPLGRLAEEVWLNPDGTIAETIVRGYDAASRLVSLKDSHTHTMLSYDHAGRLVTDSLSGDAGYVLPGLAGQLGAITLSRGYDAIGRIISSEDTINGTAGSLQSYHRDLLGRVTSVTQSGSGLAGKRADFAYNAAGQLRAIERFADLSGNQAVASTQYAYDSAGRLAEINHANAAAALGFFHLQYDAAGRVSQITTAAGTTAFDFDAVGQLTGVNKPGTAGDESYQYDANGNRVGSHADGASYEVGTGNRLTTVGGTTLEYDAEGNVTRSTHRDTGAVRQFDWDHRNRLIRVVDRASADSPAQQVVEYRYDAFDRRISKTVDAQPGDAVDAAITYFINDRDDVLAEWIDPDGSGPAPAAETVRYLHGPLIDQVLAQESESQTLWHLADQVGTVHDLIDNTGEVVNHLTYDAFGNLLEQTDPALATRFGFSGRERDQETGLNYHRARYYDTSTGRFISTDPVPHANLYIYADNNPVQNIDPLGRDATGAWIGASVGAGAGFLVAGPPGALIGGLLGGMAGDQAEKAINGHAEKEQRISSRPQREQVMKLTLEQQQRCKDLKKQREALLGQKNLSEEQKMQLLQINKELLGILGPKAFGRMAIADASLVGPDGASLVGPDGASLVGPDGASLVGPDGASLVGPDGASLVGPDGASLVGPDGASLVGPDGASLVGPDGASLVGADGASLVGPDGASLVGPDGASLVGPDGAS